MIEPFDGEAFKANYMKHLELFQECELYSAALIYARLVALRPTPPEIAYDSLNLTPAQESACAEVEALMKERFGISSNYENGIVCIGGYRLPNLASVKQEVGAVKYLELLATVAIELDSNTRMKFESVLDLIYENGVRPASRMLQQQKVRGLN